MSEKTIGRRWAPPLVIPTPGGPLVRGVPNLGWYKDRLHASVVVDADMPRERQQEYVRKCFPQFVRETELVESARFVSSDPITVTGPFPYLDAKPPNTQVGDRGGRRSVARDARADSQNTGKVKYRVEGSFWVREHIQEIRTDVAQKLFRERRPGVRAVYERE